jgi:exonuclease III
MDADIYNYFAPTCGKSRKGTPGCTIEERESMSTMLTECAMVDSYRSRNPDAKANYTYWSVRTKARDDNKGLRLDYWIVSEALMSASGDGPSLHDVYHLDQCKVENMAYCSDHCPVGITMLNP